MNRQIGNEIRACRHMTLSDLVDHICATHHAYLRRQMPVTRHHLAWALLEQGDRYRWLEDLFGLFGQLDEETREHMIREEQILFPLIQELDFAARHPGRYSGGLVRSIGEMEHDHAAAQRLIEDMRLLTGRFCPPADADEALRLGIYGLGQLNEDMRVHTYKEQHILFPRAVTTERRLRDTGKVVLGRPDLMQICY